MNSVLHRPPVAVPGNTVGGSAENPRKNRRRLRSAAKILVDYLAHQDVDRRLKQRLGLATETELLDALGVDFYYLSARDISQNENAAKCLRIAPVMTEQERTCPLGIRWLRGARDSKFSVDEALCGPFERDDPSTAEILRHPWPRARDFDFSILLPEAEANGQRQRIGGLWSGLMGDASRMRGFQNFLLDVAAEPQRAKTLVNRLTEMYLELNDHYFSTLRGKMEIWFFGSDFGTQESLLIGRDRWLELFDDNIRQLCALAHSYGLKVMMHSCGSIAPLIDDFIAAGVDILDPVQVSARHMEPEMLARQFGGRIVFHGGIDTQRILPFGTPEDVADHVRSVIATFSRYGSYIPAPSQIFHTDIPVDNILAVYQTIRRSREQTGNTQQRPTAISRKKP